MLANSTSAIVPTITILGCLCWGEYLRWHVLWYLRSSPSALPFLALLSSDSSRPSYKHTLSRQHILKEHSKHLRVTHHTQETQQCLQSHINNKFVKLHTGVNFDFSGPEEFLIFFALDTEFVIMNEMFEWIIVTASSSWSSDWHIISSFIWDDQKLCECSNRTFVVLVKMELCTLRDTCAKLETTYISVLKNIILLVLGPSKWSTATKL